MALFSRLFGGRKKESAKTIDSYEDVPDFNPWRPAALSDGDVSFMVFRECERRGPRLMFDTTTVRLTACSAADQHGLLDVEADTGFKWNRPRADAPQLGEMVFGAVAMAYTGPACKLHIIRGDACKDSGLVEDTLLLSRVFPIPRSTRRRARTLASSGTSLDDSCSSTGSELSLLRLDGTPQSAHHPRSSNVDCPPPGVRRSEDSGLSSIDSYVGPPSCLPTPYGTPISAQGSGASLGSHGSLLRPHGSSDLLLSSSCRDEVVLRHQTARTRLAVCLLVKMAGPARSRLEDALLQLSQPLQQLLSRLQAGVERAFLARRQFIRAVHHSCAAARQDLVLLLTAPRLPRPVWLGLTCGALLTGRQQRRLAELFVTEFTCLTSELDTKENNCFITTLLTAVLTHHLTWVTTLAPLAAGDGSRIDGAAGHPPRPARTLVVGRRRRTVQRLLLLLSYFIRACPATETMPWCLSPLRPSMNNNTTTTHALQTGGGQLSGGRYTEEGGLKRRQTAGLTDTTSSSTIKDVSVDDSSSTTINNTCSSNKASTNTIRNVPSNILGEREPGDGLVLEADAVQETQPCGEAPAATSDATGHPCSEHSRATAVIASADASTGDSSHTGAASSGVSPNATTSESKSQFYVKLDGSVERGRETPTRNFSRSTFYRSLPREELVADVSAEDAAVMRESCENPGVLTSCAAKSCVTGEAGGFSGRCAARGRVNADSAECGNNNGAAACRNSATAGRSRARESPLNSGCDGHASQVAGVSVCARGELLGGAGSAISSLANNNCQLHVDSNCNLMVNACAGLSDHLSGAVGNRAQVSNSLAGTGSTLSCSPERKCVGHNMETVAGTRGSELEENMSSDIRSQRHRCIITVTDASPKTVASDVLLKTFAAQENVTSESRPCERRQVENCSRRSKEDSVTSDVLLHQANCRSAECIPDMSLGLSSSNLHSNMLNIPSVLVSTHKEAENACQPSPAPVSHLPVNAPLMISGQKWTPQASLVPAAAARGMASMAQSRSCQNLAASGWAGGPDRPAAHHRRSKSSADLPAPVKFLVGDDEETLAADSQVELRRATARQSAEQTERGSEEGSDDDSGFSGCERCSGLVVLERSTVTSAGSPTHPAAHTAIRRGEVAPSAAAPAAGGRRRLSAPAAEQRPPRQLSAAPAAAVSSPQPAPAPPYCSGGGDAAADDRRRAAATADSPRAQPAVRRGPAQPPDAAAPAALSRRHSDSIRDTSHYLRGYRSFRFSQPVGRPPRKLRHLSDGSPPSPPLSTLPPPCHPATLSTVESTTNQRRRRCRCGDPLPSAGKTRKQVSLLDAGRGGPGRPSGAAWSSLGGGGSDYLPDMPLWGCDCRQAWEWRLRADLAAASAAGDECTCVLADCDSGTVEVLSSHAFPAERAGAMGLGVVFAPLVSALVESVVRLRVGGGAPAPLVLRHLEAQLEALVAKAAELAQLLITSSMTSLQEVTQLLGVDSSDVPLLLSAASVLCPEVTNKYGLSIR